MTSNEPDGESAGARRSFASRTPVNDNPDKVVYRRGFVTRHQVTGWRFVMRRIAAGIALHDTRMLVDPLRTQSRAVLTGALILITGLAGCFVFSLIRPNAQVGNNLVLADRSTSAVKSTWPGVSMMLMRMFFQVQVVAAEVIVMPRSCSCSIQSMVAVPSCTSPIRCVMPV